MKRKQAMNVKVAMEGLMIELEALDEKYASDKADIQNRIESLRGKCGHVWASVLVNGPYKQCELCGKVKA